jgi:thioredoxin-like negative regulator of GroEL
MAGTNILIQTKKQFDQLVADEKTLILYFSAKSCNVCQAFLPKLMKVVDDSQVKVAKVDINEHMEIAGQLLVFTVPTMLILHEGKEILRESRFIDLQAVERTLSLLQD